MNRVKSLKNSKYQETKRTVEITSVLNFRQDGFNFSTLKITQLIETYTLDRPTKKFGVENSNKSKKKNDTKTE